MAQPGGSEREDGVVRYLVGRAVQMVVTLLAAVTLLWFAVTVLPGDPVRALFGFTPPPPEVYQAIHRHFHLDEPVPVQYLLYLSDLLRGDLGRSYPTNPFGNPSEGVLIRDLVAGAAPVSAVIVVGALVVQALAGLLAGVLAAAGAGRWLGRSVYAVSLLLVATPVVVAAFVAKSFVAFRLGWFPVNGVRAGWTAYVLPVLSLAAVSTGYVALLTRSELLAAFGSTHVRAARARGLPPWRITTVHALRPGLVPVATFLAANVGQLVTGLIIVEGVFRVPGMGGLLFTAIREQDRNMLVGLVAVIAATIIVASALADMAVAALDPRVRLHGR